MILRRLYLYLVSAAGLALLAVGLSGLGSTIVLFVLNDPGAQYSRTVLAQWSAATLVALPVWGIHLWFAQRLARRHGDERASAIRHLYVYLACLALAVGFVINLDSAVSTALRPELEGGPFDRVLTTQVTWVAVVLLAIWALHYGMAARDRVVVGEAGASATLRRWYMYPALLIGLLLMLSGAQLVAQMAWIRVLTSSAFDYSSLSDGVARFAAGGVLWAFHARVLATRHVVDDRKSTLRAVEGFIAVGVSIVSALVGGSQILYYALARALGVNNPGHVGSDLLAAVAQPASMLVVYGIAWFFLRHRLAGDAASGEAARQAAIRSLYLNLAALVSLGAAAIGAGGLMWTALEQFEAPLIGVTAGSWRDPLSRWLTLFVVGAGVWLAHWRPAPAAPERRALSRRLYVYGALLSSVLALLGGGIGLVYAVFQQVFSVQPRLNDKSNLDFGHYLAVILVAAALGIYHRRVLVRDAASRAAAIAPAAVPAAAPVEAPGEAPAAVASTVVAAVGNAEDLVDLVDWRRQVGDLYRISGPDAITEFRRRRDELFNTHPQSPIEKEARPVFTGLRYFPPDPAYRVTARIEPGAGDELVIDTGGSDGAVRYRRAGRLVFDLDGQRCELTVFSLEQYAGGLFVPFKDATSGRETYGGGRYLIDTAKNTDGLVLETTPELGVVVLDFNYAYNPSCAYSPRWACPLAPPENALKVAVRAGERAPRSPAGQPAGGPV